MRMLYSLDRTLLTEKKKPTNQPSRPKGLFMFFLFRSSNREFGIFRETSKININKWEYKMCGGIVVDSDPSSSHPPSRYRALFHSSDVSVHRFRVYETNPTHTWRWAYF